MINLSQLDVSKTIGDLVRQLNGWRTTINSIGFPALSRGTIVSATVGVAPTSISHGLRATPRGWIVLRSIVASTAAAVSEISSDESTLTLVATGPTTVTLWIYL